MKKFSLVSLLCAAFMLVTIGAAAAPSERTITVTGHVETSVAPDVAFVTLGVLTSGADVNTAKQQNDNLMQKIAEALAEQGIAGDKIKTANLSVQPIFQQDKNSETSPAITGYRVQNTVSATVEDLNRVGQVIDAAIQAGANQFQGVRFALRDDAKLRETLLRDAILDGRHKAELMADTLGVTLDGPVSAIETGRAYPMPTESFKLMRTDAAGGTAVFPGNITATAEVNLVFAIR